MANDGMSRTPLRRAVSLTTSASLSIAIWAASCSRPPYVDSHRTKSASVTTVGSRRIGVPGRPRSPENTTIVSRPPPGRAIRIRTIAEPRMCPASWSVTWTPCATSYSVPYGIGRSIPRVRFTSSSVYSGPSRPTSTTAGAARSRSSGSGPPGAAAPATASSSASSNTVASRLSSAAARTGSRRSRRASRFANSTWSFAESSSTSRASSAVAAVHTIWPRKPFATRSGSRPQWSR